MKIIFLGTGVPTIEPRDIKAGASEIIQIGNDNLLFDCGRWVSYQLVKSGVMPWKVNHLFFTHFFHYDHTCDYLTFILNMPRRNLKVYGPKGTKLWSENLFQATGDVRAPRALGSIEINDVGEGLVCQTESWRVLAVKTTHGNSLAYRFESDNTSIVISGDITKHSVQFSKVLKERGQQPELRRDRENISLVRESAYQANQKLIDLAKGADIFIMDADASHTTPESMGIAAMEAGVKKVFLTHLQSPGSRLVRRSIWKDYNELIERMKTHYKGEIVIVEDLMEVEI